MDFLWTFLDGLSLEFLWTAWNGFQFELDWISAAICVCGQVAQAMATGEMEELYWLLFFVYIHWVFYLVFFQLTALRDVAKAAIQLQEIQVQL